MFYKDKNVLICGASGLTGHHLFNYLSGLGANVIGTCFNKNDTENNLIRVDFTNNLDSRIFFNNYKDFDYVFICSAQTYNAEMCKNNPQSMILPNLTMVSNILDNCLRIGVKKALFMSSATVYQQHDMLMKESDLNMNINPYQIYMGIGWVKRYLEKLCEFYSFKGLDCVVVRPTNIYGEYDKSDEKICHVIPAFIMRGLSGVDPFVVNSLGNGMKNFIYVKDLVRDMALCMQSKEHYDIFNLTSNSHYKISIIVEIILRMLAEKVGYKPLVKFSGDFDSISYIGLNRDKFDYHFGEQEYTSIFEGLERTIEWYSSLHQIQKR